MRRMMINLVVIVALVSALASCASMSNGDTHATLELSEGSVASGTGFSWAKGTLTYRGKKYPIKVGGLSVDEVGVDRATALGRVIDLKKLEDFDGNYLAAGGAATVARGTSVAALKNQNGVKIALKSATEGASLKLGAEGIKLSIDK